MLPLVLTAAAAVVALLAIRAHDLGEAGRAQVYLFKPLATLLILALALSLPLPQGPRYLWAVAAGLACSTLGDVFLMLRGDRFVPGLASFLVAHLCYLVAFTHEAPAGAVPAWWLSYLMVGAIMAAVLWPGLKPALRAPVAVYIAVIAAMAGQAAVRADLLGTTAARLAWCGATLFMVSDAVLAIDRFRRPFAGARAVTLSTYWAAQLLIAWSVSAA